MIAPNHAKTNKHQYWQDKIKEWQDSHLSQSVFCEQSGIKLSTFTYWRGLFLEGESKKSKKEFVPVKIIKDKVSDDNKLVQIKLLTGHVIYLPVEIGMNEIAQLIRSLGLPHA